MTATIVNEQRGALVIRVDGVASTDDAGIGEIANPEGVSLLITRATLVVHTPSTGAANLSVGVEESGADATDVINALAVNGAITGKVYNGFARQNTAVTEVTAPAVWASDEYLTFTGSASTAGLEASLFIEYYRVNEPDVTEQ